MRDWQRDLNALIVIILALILIGIYGIQFFAHLKPCPLCMMQRICMLGVAIGALLNIYFGIQMPHYAISLLSCVLGVIIALAQISIHICPGSAPPYGIPILGLSIYTWSFIIFACSILAIAFLLFMYNPEESIVIPPPLNQLCKGAFILILIPTIANIFTTFQDCKWGPC